MKTTSLLRAAVLGGGVALLANPVWAGGGAHSYDKNQAGQQRMHDSGTQISNLEKEKKKDIEQALQDKGFEPGSVDGVIDTQTQSAISQVSAGQQPASHRHGGRANGKAAGRRNHAFSKIRTATYGTERQREQFRRRGQYVAV